MIPYELRICLSRDQLFHQLVEVALKDPANGFPILADHAEESGMPALAGILRRHRTGSMPAPDYWHGEPDNYGYGSMLDDETDEGQPSGTWHKIKRGPELIPGVHMVYSNGGYHGHWDHGEPQPKGPMRHEGPGFHVFDMRGLKYPQFDWAGLDGDQAQEDIRAMIPKPHYFQGGPKRDDGLRDVHELETK